MLKKTTLLFAVLSLSACSDVNYDSETRLVVQGRLTDYNDRPIANRSIDVAVFNDNDGEYAAENAYPKDVISYGNSDADGQFKLVFPAPKGEFLNIGVRINKNAVGYQQKQFLKMRVRDFAGYRYDFHAIKLYKSDETALLTIQPSASDPNHQLLELHVEGFLADDFVYVNPIESNPYAVLSDYLVRKNQTVTIRYRVADYSDPAAVITEHTADVPVGQEQSINYMLHF